MKLKRAKVVALGMAGLIAGAMGGLAAASPWAKNDWPHAAGSAAAVLRAGRAAAVLPPLPPVHG